MPRQAVHARFVGGESCAVELGQTQMLCTGTHMVVVEHICVISRWVEVIGVETADHGFYGVRSSAWELGRESGDVILRKMSVKASPDILSNFHSPRNDIRVHSAHEITDFSQRIARWQRCSRPQYTSVMSAEVSSP